MGVKERIVQQLEARPWADEAVRRAEAVAQRLRLRSDRFEWGGEKVPYFVHAYNATWRNERAVEVPIARGFIARQGAGYGMELGNVLAHYGPISHLVVDKYEQSPGVLNVDIVEFQAERPLDWIVAISTFEHVGWDEPQRDPAKVGRAIQHLRTQLAPEGRMLITVPRGYNTGLDDLIKAGEPEPVEQAFLHRDPRGTWVEEEREAALAREVAYVTHRARADDIWVAEFTHLAA